MAKKIRAKDAQEGKFYVIEGDLYICIGWDGNAFDFQQVGHPGKRWCNGSDKIKPVNLFMFSK